jgi:hypothetical protein
MRKISGPPARARRYTGRNGVTVPNWFARELSLIDERYYVTWDDDNGYYRIQLDVYQLVNIGKEIVRINHPLTRAVFDDFDRRVLDDMQKRKWINRHFRTNDRYYKWLKAQEEERKAKEHENATDMMAEGIIKMDRMENTKTFTY